MVQILFDGSDQGVPLSADKFDMGQETTGYQGNARLQKEDATDIMVRFIGGTIWSLLYQQN